MYISESDVPLCILFSGYDSEWMVGTFKTTGHLKSESSTADVHLWWLVVMQLGFLNTCLACIKLGVVTHANNSSTSQMEARESRVQDHSRLPRELTTACECFKTISE